MKDLKKEIDEITEQKEWRIPDEVFKKAVEKRESANPIIEARNRLVREQNILERKLDGIKQDFWIIVHEGMPELPIKASYEFNDEEQKIKLKEKKNLKEKKQEPHIKVLEVPLNEDAFLDENTSSEEIAKKIAKAIYNVMRRGSDEAE